MQQPSDNPRDYMHIEGHIRQEKFEQPITHWIPQHIMPINDGYYLCWATELDIFVGWFTASKRQWEIQKPFVKWMPIPI